MKTIFRRLLGKLTKAPKSKELHNIRTELQRIATHSTALYVKEHMSHVSSVSTWHQVHDKAIAEIKTDGLVLEFGVFSGNTINYIASKLPDCRVHGFDSFEGLPEFWRDGFGKGFFSTSIPEVLPNVTLHKGWFDDSIPSFLREIRSDRDQRISYLHVDCDLYSSTKTIFDELENLINVGTVIVFDEYFNYDGWENGEFKAFHEFMGRKKLNYRYITYNHLHEQVALLITE